VAHITMLIEIAKTKKPIIMSTGMSSIKEIKFAIKTLKKFGKRDIALLKCTSSYPAMYKDLNLNTIIDMKKKFKNFQIGFSDHTKDSVAAINAISKGATIIEKHISLSKNSVDGSFSSISKNFKNFVDDCNHSWLSNGKKFYGVSSGEKGSSTRKRSLCISNYVKRNERFTEKNLRVVRGSDGLHSKYYYKIINKKRAKKSLEIGTFLTNKMIK
jgi:pseudaminic acid synthase